MIGSMMRQNILTSGRREFFRRVIEKMIVEMCRSNNNVFLVKWCQEQLEVLRKEEKTVRELSEWMDLEDD